MTKKLGGGLRQTRGVRKKVQVVEEKGKKGEMTTDVHRKKKRGSKSAKELGEPKWEY